MNKPFYVVKDSQPVSALIIGYDDSILAQQTAKTITATIRNLMGIEIPVKKGIALEEQSCMIIGTPDSNPEIKHRLPGDLADLGEQGYLIRVVRESVDFPFVLVAGNTPQAVYYGAVYLTDFLMSFEGANLIIRDADIRRFPALQVRGTYNLACWGIIHKYRKEDWQTIIDAMAEDSMNTIYFWLSGLFRSQKHPEAFTYKETTMTTEDIRQLIRYAQERGVKFYLGSGLFSWLAIDALANAYPESAAKGAGGMCPSSEKARQLNMEYLMEMYDAFPEADGFFLEMRDEYGECTNEVCQKVIDEYGSKQYGESEITFLQELARKTWEKNPEAVLTTAIGYAPHSSDVRYYETIRKMDDPRLHWLVVRGNWDLPGAAGQPYPLTHFSRNMIHWDHYYQSSIEQIKAICERAANAGLLGYCPAFEPGFDSASYYSEVIPFPVNLIPYRITRFAYREFCWNPGLSIEDFKERLYAKFFSSEIPYKMVDSLLVLFDFIRTNYRWASGRALLERIEKGDIPENTKNIPGNLNALKNVYNHYGTRLQEIENDILSYVPTATAKSKVTLDMMMRCIQDTKERFCFEPGDMQRLDAAILQVEKHNREAMKSYSQKLSLEGEVKIDAHLFMCENKGDYDGVKQAAWIYKDQRMNLSFDIVGELYDLIFTFRGVNNEKDYGTPTILMSMNGNTIFDAPSPFAPNVYDNNDDEWSEFRVEVPESMLKPEGNTLEIWNVLSTGNWWMIDYMVIRRKE